MESPPSPSLWQTAFAWTPHVAWVPSEGWWSRRVTVPHQLACRASALLVCHDPENGKSPWCCPRLAEFWGLSCTSWCATCFALNVRNAHEVRIESAFRRQLVRLPGIALGPSPWQEDILLLNHSREN